LLDKCEELVASPTDVVDRDDGVAFLRLQIFMLQVPRLDEALLIFYYFNNIILYYYIIIL